MNIDKIFNSKFFKGLILGLTIFIVLLLVFKLGAFIGARRANFSCRWSENYQRNFGGPKPGPIMGLGDRDFIPAGGTTGQIIKIDDSILTIKEINNTEKTVLIKEDTAVRKMREEIKASDLKINDFVVIIGEPNKDGQIEAKLIRVMPEPSKGDLNFLPKKKLF